MCSKLINDSLNPLTLTRIKQKGGNSHYSPTSVKSNPLTDLRKNNTLYKELILSQFKIYVQ